MDLTNLVGFHGTSSSGGRDRTEGMGARGKSVYRRVGRGCLVKEKAEPVGHRQSVYRRVAESLKVCLYSIAENVKTRESNDTTRPIGEHLLCTGGVLMKLSGFGLGDLEAREAGGCSEGVSHSGDPLRVVKKKRKGKEKEKSEGPGAPK